MTETRQTTTEFKVLLMAPNWLGDAVMFSALVEFLHGNRDLISGRHLVLDLAVRAPWAPLFQKDSRLNNLIILDRGGRHGGLAGGWHAGTDFRTAKPDAVLLGPPSFRAGIAAWRSGANIRIGYQGDSRNFLLTHGIPTPVRGVMHHSEELVALGRLLLKVISGSEKAVPSQEDLPKLDGCLSIPPATSASSEPLWVFAPGATYGSAKSWPVKPAMEFVREAVLNHGVRLVLLGDSSATAYAASLAQQLEMPMRENIDGGPGLVDLTGRTDLTQVVSILKASQAFVGIDSGLMHLAAALDVPTIGVFGSSNPHWTSPRGARTGVVSAAGFECRPCYLKTCNQPEFCLDTIDGARVLAAVDELLLRNGK